MLPRQRPWPRGLIEPEGRTRCPSQGLNLKGGDPKDAVSIGIPFLLPKPMRISQIHMQPQTGVSSTRLDQTDKWVRLTLHFHHALTQSLVHCKH